VTTAKANGLNPRAYLEWLLRILPNTEHRGDEPILKRSPPWSDNIPLSCRADSSTGYSAEPDPLDKPIIDIGPHALGGRSCFWIRINERLQFKKSGLFEGLLLLISAFFAKVNCRHFPARPRSSFGGSSGNAPVEDGEDDDDDPNPAEDPGEGMKPIVGRVRTEDDADEA
jgi:hypothetical protein